MSSFEPSSSPPSKSNEMLAAKKITPYLSKSPPPPPTDSPDDEDKSGNENMVGADMSFNNHNLTATTNEEDEDDELPQPQSFSPSTETSFVAQTNNQSPIQLNNNESTTTTNNNHEENQDDDEWADFVDSSSAPIPTTNMFIPIETTVPVNIEIKQPPAPPSITDSPQSVPNLSIPQPPPPPQLQSQKSNEQEEEEEVEEETPFDFDVVSSRVVNRILATNEKTARIGNGSMEVSEASVDEDEVWKSLREFTCVNDASTSLKFRWLFSELENNFLHSINVEREDISAQQKPYANYLSNGGVLQPTKFDTTTTGSNANHIIMTSFDELTTTTNQKTINKPVSSRPETSNSSNVSTPVLDIDLSYFEKSTTTTSVAANNKPNPNVKQQQQQQQVQSNSSKTYINELLKEIYLNTANDNNESTLNSKK